MRFTYVSIVAVTIVMIAVAIAGCASTSPAAPSTGGAPSGGAAAPAGASTQAGGSSVSGSQLFGGLNYNWVEYKMSTGSGSQAMTIYMKYDRQTGKCTMRFEGAAAAQMPANMQNIDCSSKGGQAQANPNQVSSDAQVSCSPIDESVTVPAGTFSATKCTVTSQGSSSTVWVVKNKFLVKMEGSSPQGGSVSMVLNAYG